jgi:tight adherence protein C
LGKRFLFPDTEPELRLWMERAGVGGVWSTEQVVRLKLVLTTGGFLLALTGFLIGIPYSPLGFVLLPLAGFFAPVVWIRRMAQMRRDRISADMPDFLDMMSLALQAGASIDQALLQVPSMFSGPLRDEILRLQQELELGVEFAAAWQRVLERNESPELQKLANSVLQAKRLGVSVVSVIRMQADDMRRMRMERGKERAAKASPKITLITTVLMAPSVFLLIVGLLALNVFYNPGGLGIDMLFR